MLKEDLKHITINDLLSRKEISVQAGNCCTTHKCHTLFDIVSLYNRGRFRHTKKQIRLELQELYRKYVAQIEKNVISKKAEYPSNQLNTLQHNIVNVPDSLIIETKEDLKQITIKTLLNRNEISSRIYSICIKYNYQSLFDIVELYEKSKLFFTFRHAGKEIYLELQDLCKKYTAQFETIVIENDNNLSRITTEHLYNTNQISVRTANCCIAAGLDTLYKIVLSFKDNGSFLKQKIRNAGRQTCDELDELSQKYIVQLIEEIKLNDIPEEEKFQKRQEEIKNLIETDFVNATDNNLVDANDILNYLTDNQKVILRSKYDKLITAYSTRTMNRLQEIGFDTFVSLYLFRNNSELLKIRHIGKKSLDEMIDLKHKVKNDFSQLINSSKEDVFKLELIRQKGEVVQDDFVFDFFRKYNHLPMFWILEQTLRKDNTRSIQILIDAFPIFQNQQVIPLESIAEKFGITRERVRQIRNKAFNKTFEVTDENVEYKKNCDLVRYSELLQNKDDWSYLLEFIKGASLNQESIEVQECLKKEQCNLSVKYALQIIAYIFRDNFLLFGGFEISNKSRVWKNTFLIRREFTDIFDFERLKNEFEDYIANSEIERDLDIGDYLTNSACWTSVIDLNKFDNIVNIAKNILLYEFHLYSNFDGLITIPATKERNLSDVVYEILQQNGNPMHLENIFVEFKRIFPEHKYTKASQLRSFLYRNEAISHRNRNSVYTLKEWEHIKFGTIRDAIVEFLSENNTPQTAKNITQFVLQYFPKTNIKSVRTTMLNETQKRFSFFENNLVGLTNKEYPTEYHYRSDSTKQELKGTALDKSIEKTR